MRLLFVATDFPPQVGGLQEYARAICAELPLALLKHALLLIPEPPSRDQLPRAPELGYTLLKARGRFQAFGKSILPILRLKRVHRLDCQLHLQWSTAVVSWLLRRLGLPSRYFVLVHGAELLDPGRPLLHRLKRSIFAHADGVAAGSQFTLSLFRRQGYACRREAVIPYGNPAAEAAPCPPPHTGSGNGSRGWKILCMHRLVARKGTALLFEALGGIRDHEWSLALVGDGAEKGALEKLAAALAISDRVQFRPPVDAAHKRRLLCEADLFVLPSLPPGSDDNYAEGLGLALLEAQSAGTPVLAARTGGIPEALAEGETGLLFRAGDVHDLERALRALLEDPDRARAMGRRAPGWIKERFSWEKCITNLERFIVEGLPGP